MLSPILYGIACLACTPKVLSSLFSETTRPKFQHDGSLATNFYPAEDVLGPKPLPAWVSAYQGAKSQGLIPSMSPSVLSNGSPRYPQYSEHVLSNPEEVCSWTISKCNSTEDIRMAPRGKIGISFDDGPQKPTSRLLAFLRQHNQTATHFLIGSRILDKPKLLLETWKKNHDHLAVHTWSHPYMTTMTDEQVLGEIGWTMQIIHDLTGLVPAFWRPPYGDVDNRVRAISRHVFGLRTVMWSVDANDWCLSDESSPGSECEEGSGPQNMHQLMHALKYQVLQGVSGDDKIKFPKHGIISLEHELSQRTVRGFMKTYPLAKSLGWDTKAIPDLFGLKWYQEARSNSSHAGILPKLVDWIATDSPSPPNTSNLSDTPAPVSQGNHTENSKPTASANTSNASPIIPPGLQGNDSGFLIVPRPDSKRPSIPNNTFRGVATTLKPFLNFIYLAYLTTIVLIYTFSILNSCNFSI